MQISELRDEVDTRLQEFAWDQWAQLGVLASTERRDKSAADPEALVLLTLEVGRDEPRLFDELLDWLVINERLMSVQRLRNLARDDEDRVLVDAALEWVSSVRPRARLRGTPGKRSATPVPLFRSISAPIAEPDQAFLQHGFLRGPAVARGHSREPDFTAPIAFAFRLRQLVGVGARAEALRPLLTIDAPSMQVQVIANSAGFAKRNVQEALSALGAAGVIRSMVVGNEQRYSADRRRWAQLFDLSSHRLPTHRDWPQIFFGFRLILRWLHAAEREAQSDYMRASDARVLMDEVGPLFAYAGARTVDRARIGADYWGAFVDVVRQALDELTSP